jgi:hypothetical protein
MLISFFLTFLGGCIVCVTRFALKLTLRDVQKMVTIVFSVVPGMCLPHICNLHHHHQNHQHQLKVQVVSQREGYENKAHFLKLKNEEQAHNAVKPVTNVTGIKLQAVSMGKCLLSQEYSMRTY